MLKIIHKKRSYDRLDLNLQISELGTGKCLGITKNIHCEGMTLMTVEPFIVEEAIQVVIKLPGADDSAELMVTAVYCWSDHDKNNQIYNVRFRFLYPTPEMKIYYETVSRQH
jgi:hypothetical protein